MNRKEIQAVSALPSPILFPAEEDLFYRNRLKKAAMPAKEKDIFQRPAQPDEATIERLNRLAQQLPFCAHRQPASKFLL